MSDTTIGHDDHDKTEAQTKYLSESVRKECVPGFFIHTTTLPGSLGTLENGLYGPSVGDKAVSDDEVTMVTRGDRPWADRMVKRPMRQSNIITGIGILAEDKSIRYFTVHGGPCAPQNPSDPNNKDVEGAKKFWAEHALAMG